MFHLWINVSEKIICIFSICGCLSKYLFTDMIRVQTKFTLIFTLELSFNVYSVNWLSLLSLWKNNALGILMKCTIVLIKCTLLFTNCILMDYRSKTLLQMIENKELDRYIVMKLYRTYSSFISTMICNVGHEKWTKYISPSSSFGLSTTLWLPPV